MRVTPSRRLTCCRIPLRGAALTPLAALAVHQLRFYVVFGSRAPAVLAREGHGYLQVAEPIGLLMATLGLGWFVGRLALAGTAARAPGDAAPAPRAILRLWLVCAAVLFAIYCAQELLEGFFAPRHPTGLAAVLGQGGWTAAPISLLVGAALAIALRVAHRLLEVVEGRLRPHWTIQIQAPAASKRGDRRTADWRLDPRAGIAAGRAPPWTLSRT